MWFQLWIVMKPNPWHVLSSVLSHFSYVWLFATPWTVAHQALPSTGFSRQEHWSGLSFPPPGDLPGPRSELPLLGLLHRQVAFFFFFLPLAPPRKPSLSAVHRAKSAAKSGRSCTAKRGRLIALCWPLVKCRPHPLNSSHGGQDPCWQSCWIYYTLGIQRDGGQYPMISQRVLKQLETIRNEMNVHTKFITHT